MDIEATIQLGADLWDACFNKRGEVQRLIELGAPFWYQEPDSGWTALHVAAHVQDEDLVKLLLDNSAIWNAVDSCGFTAGDVALSLNNTVIYRLIRDAGLRSEFLLHVLDRKANKPEQSIILKSSDDSAAGSSSTFLESRLQYIIDDSGQEICVAVLPNEEEVGVMMGWESNLMLETARKMITDRHQPQTDLHVLNIGFGLGLIDKLFQSTANPPAHHVIVEPHPDVLSYMRAKGWYNKPGVTVLEGKWQDVINSESLYSFGGFDLIYTDTFSEDYSDLVEFFEHVPNLLRDEDSRFSFFNGLGATNALFYDVYSNLAELHLADIGLRTQWEDVPVKDDITNGTWGNKRVYFSLPLYRLPICGMN